MAIYTCRDMISDCRANHAPGWRHLITQYVPVIRLLLDHYYPDRGGDAKLIERVLVRLRDPGSNLYAAPAPDTEREFVSKLRQKVLEAAEADHASQEPDVPVTLETLTEALEPLTATERQFVWFEAMGQSAESTAKMLNLEAGTIQSARDRADELLRGKMDRWHKGLIAQNGFALGRLAASGAAEDCLPPKAFLDSIDGRITWKQVKDYEFHLIRCWHCVDHFCRIREADYGLRLARPLAEQEAVPLYSVLQLPEEKKSMWQKMFAR